MFIYRPLSLSKTKRFGYRFNPDEDAPWTAAIALQQRLRVESFENTTLKRWSKLFQDTLRLGWIISFSWTTRSIFPIHMPTHFASSWFHLNWKSPGVAFFIHGRLMMSWSKRWQMLVARDCQFLDGDPTTLGNVSNAFWQIKRSNLEKVMFPKQIYNKP